MDNLESIKKAGQAFKKQAGKRFTPRYFNKKLGKMKKRLI